MDDKLVIVMIAAYNAEEYICETIESILVQSYKNFKVVICDDCSTDQTVNKIEGFKDRRIELIKNSENLGKSVCLNKIIEATDGDFYMMQDADDTSHPDRIKLLVSFIELNPSVDLIMSGYQLIIDNESCCPRGTDLTINECQELVAQYKMPSHDPTMFIKAVVVSEVRFDRTLRIGQGLDFILRVGEKYNISVIENVLYNYRVHPSSITRMKRKKRNTMISKIKLEAYERRKVNSKIPIINYPHANSDSDKYNNLYVHFIESVRYLLQRRKIKNAFCVSFKSIRYGNFVMINYYKPLAIAIINLGLIRCYP
ncbi:glycosyltransferase family 2 protein [Marinobacterium mangrovicola]|uniref:Glycosyl transferase family 2 n=1 Tax=Marinobacterium mangrovicola TaxID=1476959 RepID=A0A4R1GKQ4_9GAMM|nr:glycosyltransferase family A protein [Marinobacterium mangrovicola]TCK07535.1 glycosyl transferase family 2 [Marinobacterium mangrovicola]